ncbi:MAG: hypothetical protein KAR43_06575, partial [Deltaproteobacteria bacterium]|nr:hypothetical protein [Deltaproteobacteria bacterium]
MSLEEIREMVKKKGYNYSVGETSVFNLPPEERRRLFGSIPTNIDESRLTSVTKAPQFLALPLLPTSFDWRDLGGVTPVKNQNPCQSCWAFAAVADLESKILISESTTYDISEQNMLSCNSYGLDCNTGGNYLISTSFFMHVGSSLESCAPYQGRDGIPCDDTCETIKMVNGWKRIANDVDTIKRALYDNGPIYTSMFASGPGFHAYTGGVYEYNGSDTPNHAVLIVGWDDNLGTSGAWIVKNSWGTDWGMDGYFYIAYGSARIGEGSNYISSYKDYDADETLLYYDEGLPDSIGFKTTTAAVIFTPTVTASVTAVDFWAVYSNVSYEIEIYDGMEGDAMENLLTSQSGSCQEFGYYSIDLNDPVPVTNGDDFVVSVKFTTTTGYTKPIPLSAHLPIESGKSYLSLDGTSWMPIGDGTSVTFDIGIRARLNSDSGGDLDVDSDGDGVFDGDDNCPSTPNGPDGGTCTEGSRIGDPCKISGDNTGECGPGGFCSMDQEDTYPPDGNNCGDACECEGDFDNNLGVDGL